MQTLVVNPTGLNLSERGDRRETGNYTSSNEPNLLFMNKMAEINFEREDNKIQPSQPVWVSAVQHIPSPRPEL